MGIFEYKNHYEMKMNRLKKLKETHGKCEVCGSFGDHIHHIDGSKDNHSLDNLIFLCCKCHGIVHGERKNKKTATSKFIRIYGMTLRSIAEEFGGSESRYYKWHKKNILKNFLDKNKPCVYNESVDKNNRKVH